MDNKQQERWYFKTWALIVSFLSVGPLMLPLVWVNPGFSKVKKIIISVVIVILSYFLTAFFLGSLKSLSNYYQLLQI